MARAKPKGVKHASCLDHIAHTFIKSGWLCVSKTWTPEDLTSVADHVQRVAAEHSAAHRARSALPTAKWRRAFVADMVGGRSKGSLQAKSVRGMASF